MERKYYTYIYLDPRKPGNYEYTLENEETIKFDYEPFYVGKGTGRRDLHHVYLRNNQKTHNSHLTSKIIKINKVLNLKPIILRIKDNITETESLNLEKSIIKIIGRKDLKQGVLVNHNEGGESIRNNITSDKQRTHKAIFKKGLIPWNKGLKYNHESRRQENLKNLKVKYGRKMIHILQYDLNGNFIKEWESASEIIKYGFKNINSMFNRKSNYSQGFQWFRKNDNEIENKINPYIFSTHSRNRKYDNQPNS